MPMFVESALKLFTEGALTTVSGRPFHEFTTRLLNVFARMFNRDLLFLQFEGMTSCGCVLGLQ